MDGVLTWHVQDPGFKHWYQKKKNHKNNMIGWESAVVTLLHYSLIGLLFHKTIQKDIKED